MAIVYILKWHTTMKAETTFLRYRAQEHPHFMCLHTTWPGNSSVREERRKGHGQE